MSPFAPDEVGPRELASQATATARWHDVVVASSKLLHGVPLQDDDRAVLRWADGLISYVASKDVMFSMASANQLAQNGQTLAILRKAAEASDEGSAELLGTVQRGLQSALDGVVDEDARTAVGVIQALFAAAARVALQTQVRLHTADEPSDPWAAWTTNLTS